MAQALILINTVAGSNPPNGVALVVGASVQLNNQNAGGETTYLWEWVDKPEGSFSAFSNANIQNPTFVADCEGTYLIKLTVNRLLSTIQVDQVLAAVKQVKSLYRIPAAGETQEESTSRGWAEDVNRALRTLDDAQANQTKIVAYANGSLSTGAVVYFDSIQTIKSTLPGEEKVPRLALAQASSSVVSDQPLYVVHSKVGGGTSISSGQLCYVSTAGIIGPLAIGSGVATDPVYVTDSGLLSTTPGTNTRRMGHIIYVDGVNYYIAIDGSSLHPETPMALGAVNFSGGSIIDGSAADLSITSPDSVIVEGTDDVIVEAGDEINLSTGGVSKWKVIAAGDLVAQGTTRLISNVKDPFSAQDAATKTYAESVAGSAFVWGNADTPGSATEVVLDPGFCDRTAPAAGGAFPEIFCPFSGTVTKLTVRCTTGPDAASDCTVYVNNTVTGITCQIAIAGTSAADGTHTAAITAGQRLSVHVKGAGGTTVGLTNVTATVFVRRT